jgi:hypothetical protein
LFQPLAVSRQRFLDDVSEKMPLSCQAGKDLEEPRMLAQLLPNCIGIDDVSSWACKADQVMFRHHAASPPAAALQMARLMEHADRILSGSLRKLDTVLYRVSAHRFKLVRC